MKVLLSWLCDFIELREPAAELAHALTMAGMAVDAVEEEDGETLFEIDVTSNRPDAMNHFGIARELAAIYGRELRPPETSVSESGRPAAEAASIEILDPDLCPRYSARVVEGVEVKPSPGWLRRRLELCGVRSINNIADLTNYVLLELGHPTHAFDLDLLGGKRIVVRRAAAGETLCTLDGIDRALSEEHLVIADIARPVALAGVMGGLETEISDSTRNVLLESAWFLPGSVRRTARHFGMHTEASHRFERGADVEATVWAAGRIAHLLQKVSPGSVLRGVIDAYPGKKPPQEVLLRKRTVQRILGLDVPGERVEAILQALGFAAAASGGAWQVRIPTHRLDVSREIDLVEEVARIHGYDRLAETLPLIGAPAEPAPFAAEEEGVRRALSALGYDEAVTYTFLSEAEARSFGSFPAVKIRNPLSELWSHMRNSPVPGILQAVAHNLNRNETRVRLAELGRLYRRGENRFEEPPILCLAMAGWARTPALFDPGKQAGFYELKSDVERIVAAFDAQQTHVDQRELPSYYAPGASARIQGDGVTLAWLGEIAPRILEDHKIRQKVFVAELFLDRLYALGLRRPQYRPLPRVPAVHRDFSLFVPEGIQFDEITAAIGPQEYLVRLEPVEIFRGEQVPEGHYSLLLRAVWQKGAESLTDEEVNGYAAQLAAGLERKLAVKQRV